MGVFKDMGLWYSFPDLQYGSFGPKRALERMPAPGSTPSCGGISRQFAGWFSKTWMILQGLVSMSQCFTSPNYWGYFISNRYGKVMFKIPKKGHLPTPVKHGDFSVRKDAWRIHVTSRSFLLHFVGSWFPRCWSVSPRWTYAPPATLDPVRIEVMEALGMSTS